MIKLVKHGYNLLRNATRAVGLEKRSSKWPKVEKDFLSKHPVCEACGSNKKLNVHHKKPYHLHPELELDENNLITLCMEKECHLLIGHLDDFKAYNPNVERDVELVKKDNSYLDTIISQAKNNRRYE